MPSKQHGAGRTADLIVGRPEHSLGLGFTSPYEWGAFNDYRNIMVGLEGNDIPRAACGHAALLHAFDDEGAIKSIPMAAPRRYQTFVERIRNMARVGAQLVRGGGARRGTEAGDTALPPPIGEEERLPEHERVRLQAEATIGVVPHRVIYVPVRLADASGAAEDDANPNTLSTDNTGLLLSRKDLRDRRQREATAAATEDAKPQERKEQLQHYRTARARRAAFPRGGYLDVWRPRSPYDNRADESEATMTPWHENVGKDHPYDQRRVQAMDGNGQWRSGTLSECTDYGGYTNEIHYEDGATLRVTDNEAHAPDSVVLLPTPGQGDPDDAVLSDAAWPPENAGKVASKFTGSRDLFTAIGQAVDMDADYIVAVDPGTTTVTDTFTNERRAEIETDESVGTVADMICAMEERVTVTYEHLIQSTTLLVQLDVLELRAPRHWAGRRPPTKLWATTPVRLPRDGEDPPSPSATTRETICTPVLRLIASRFQRQTMRLRAAEPRAALWPSLADTDKRFAIIGDASAQDNKQRFTEAEWSGLEDGIREQGVGTTTPNVPLLDGDADQAMADVFSQKGEMYVWRLIRPWDEPSATPRWELYMISAAPVTAAGSKRDRINAAIH